MKTFILMFFFIPVMVFGKPEPVSFNFQKVSLVIFGQAVFKEMLHRDFVVSPEVVEMNPRVSISVKSIDVTEVPKFVESLLKQQGIDVVLKENIYYLSSSKSTLETSISSPISSDVAIYPLSPVKSLSEKCAMERCDIDGFPIPDEVQVFKPINRPVDFMVTVINAAFGSSYARPAGNQVTLSVPKIRLPSVLVFVTQVDSVIKLVEVAASFVEVSSTGSSNRGLSLVSSVLATKFGATVTPGTGTVTVSSGSFQLVLDALDADGRFKQVANARLVGEDGQRMTLNVGDETPTIGSSGKDNQGNLLQNIVYRSSGVIVDALAKVLGSGAVSLMIDGQISNFQSTLNGVNGSPTLIKRSVKTGVTIPDGQVIIIGGLDDTKSNHSQSGFSFLPTSWASRSTSDVHSDLLLILSAKVMPN